MQAVDLCSGGRARAVAAWVVDDTLLVDPGPEATVETLLARLGGWRAKAIALTHIHLDHAGATGTLLERWPECQVWAHERAVRHLLDPRRLLDSARRVYGAQLDRLWGSMRPVPAEAVRAVHDGQRLGPLEVLETPGHARHHLAYLHLPTGTCLTGDLAGVRIPPSSRVLAPTVPPDFDPDAWQASIRRVAERRPTQLALPHFGLHADAQRHLQAAAASVRHLASAARRLDQPAFTAAVHNTLAGAGDAQTIAAYEHAIQPQILWAGAAADRRTQP